MCFKHLSVTDICSKNLIILNNFSTNVLINLSILTPSLRAIGICSTVCAWSIYSARKKYSAFAAKLSILLVQYGISILRCERELWFFVDEKISDRKNI